MEKVCTLLISFDIPSRSHDYVLFNIDDNCACLNDLLISLSSDMEKTRFGLFEVKNKIEKRNSRIESLITKLKHVTLDRDVVRIDNILLVRQQSIYYNTAKRLYGKITSLYHS